ncbi:MAG: ferredoxin [Deltaproteobacteria bacterium]|nr:ferredoxin [Deltaproteobacteria bacterium]
MASEIYVDKSDCTGCGNCVDLLPDVFRLDEDDLSELIPGSWESAGKDDMEQAIDDCAGQCIEWK